MATYSDEEHPQIKIGNLTSYSRQVYTIVKVISKTEAREVTSRSDDSQHRVCEALVADDTGNASKPNLDTYTTINGFSPDVKYVSLGGAGESYQASIV